VGLVASLLMWTRLPPCLVLQGPSTCSYFDPSHIHSVDYKITSSSFGSHVRFTFRIYIDHLCIMIVCAP